jgi:hypothetical protein
MTPEQKSVLTKRFQTTMIGALHEFEKAFGYLWGINKSEDQLTDSELDFEDRWILVRNQILNNGNHQLRKCLADFDSTKYHYKLYKRNNEE